MNNRHKNKYPLVNNRIMNEMLLYLLIFSTIALSRDTLISLIKIGFSKAFVIYIAMIIFYTVLLLITNRKIIKIRKNATYGIGAFIIILLLSSLLKLDFQLYIISIIFYIYTAYLFIYLFTFEDFFEKFTNIMVALSVISLVACYVLKPFTFPGGARNGYLTIVVNSAGLEFFDLGLSYVVAFPYYIRNFGIFREPGIYQFFLIVPLIYQLLLKKNKIKIVKVLVLVLTIISTFSLTGIIVMGLVVATYIFKLYLEGKIDKRLRLYFVITGIIIILIGIILYFTNLNFQSIINESFKKLFTLNESTGARGGSIIINIKLFIKSMLFGNDFSVVQYASVHNTNSTFSLFAMFGIMSGVLHLWYQYLFSIKVSNFKLIRGCTLVILLLIVNTQFLIGNPVFWIVTFSIFMINNNEEVRDRQWSIEYFIINIYRTLVLKLKSK